MLKIIWFSQLLLIFNTNGTNKNVLCFSASTHVPGGPEHTTIFYIANGPDVKKGEIEEQINIDVAVTAMQHLGIEIKESWNLDAKVAGLGINKNE